MDETLHQEIFHELDSSSDNKYRTRNFPITQEAQELHEKYMEE
jgi:hypothetical protein